MLGVSMTMVVVVFLLVPLFGLLPFLLAIDNAEQRSHCQNCKHNDLWAKIRRNGRNNRASTYQIKVHDVVMRCFKNNFSEGDFDFGANSHTWHHFYTK